MPTTVKLFRWQLRRRRGGNRHRPIVRRLVVSKLLATVLSAVQRIRLDSLPCDAIRSRLKHTQHRPAGFIEAATESYLVRGRPDSGVRKAVGRHCPRHQSAIASGRGWRHSKYAHLLRRAMTTGKPRKHEDDLLGGCFSKWHIAAPLELLQRRHDRFRT